MRSALLKVRTVVMAGIVLSVLGFGASAALARPSSSCDNPPVVVGSCAEPGFDCQATCVLANPGTDVTGSCQPTGQQCCICFVN